MNEYKITKQALDSVATREMDLHPPSGDEWTLHSVEHSATDVTAVWERPKRLHAMSDVYSHAESETSTGPHTGGKTIADMPEPKAR